MLLDLLSTGMFRLCHGSQLVYNTCWEDPRLDRIALGIGRLPFVWFARVPYFIFVGRKCEDERAAV